MSFQKPLEGRQCFRTDVMLNPLGIQLGSFFGDAQRTQKGHHGFMPAFAFLGELAAGVGQKNGPVRLGAHMAGPLQPRQRAVDGHMRDAQSPRQIRHARLALRQRQISDRLDVILRDLHRPVAPRPAEIFRRLRGRSRWR